MIRWGILGAGKIAHRFARSLRQEPDSCLVAISCRTREKAEAFGREFDVPRRYTDHETLLRDDEVDAIYLALPHGLHGAWAVRALRAGKAVLCEKPATLCAAEMCEVAAAARESGRLFMEAMKPRFVPAHAAIRRLLDEGAIGSLVRVDTSLCNAMQDGIQGTYHTQPGQGGVLLDCGIYCASWLEELTTGPFEREVLERIYAKQAAGAGTDSIDLYVDAYLRAGSTALRLECAFDRKKPREAVLVGTRGRIVVEELHRPQAFTLLRDGCAPERREYPYEVDDFYGEIHHFVQCLQEGRTESPQMPLAASIRCAEILDCVRAGLRYTPHCLNVLQQQEQQLQYERFGSAEALRLGNIAAQLAAEYDRGVGVAITRESDGLVLFQYAMDDKTPRNLGFMEGKRRAALACGHSSLWAYVEPLVRGEQPPKPAPDFVPTGGAFPIRVQGEWVATISVSGLHEGKDHELAVRALAQALGREAPPFPAAAI
jgi:predicted dehydrogenase/uncharacterized protein (UPF0303 family)